MSARILILIGLLALGVGQVAAAGGTKRGFMHLDAAQAAGRRI